jgi:hypothetical protein
MAINPLGATGAAISGAGSPSPVKQTFGSVMKGPTGPGAAIKNLESQPPASTGPATEAKSVTRATAGKRQAGAAAPSAAQASAVKVLDQVSRAQSRMDQILKLAESGKTFSPAELLSLQAHIYRASQELDLAGKVVEKSTGGVKQVLQTQL